MIYFIFLALGIFVGAVLIGVVFVAIILAVIIAIFGGSNDSNK